MITNFRVVNFRSHSDRLFEFDKFTVIVGPNGAGKTNILEAVWMLATTKSFRTHRDHEVIRWGEHACYLQGDHWEIGLSHDTTLHKSLKINGVTHRPLSYLGDLRAVYFSPDTLEIIQGAPVERRRFLDTILAQRQQSMAAVLTRYRRIVSQRNALLRLIARGEAAPDQLDLWDQQLVATGCEITNARAILLEAIVPIARRYFLVLSGGEGAAIDLTYHQSAPSETERFLVKLLSLRSREILLQTSLLGPHRDDLVIERAGRPIIDHASRGEMRSIVLALKWAEYQLLRSEDHEPVLLLDDLFSELDKDHRRSLSQFLETAQVICTTTDLENLPANLQSHGRPIYLSSSKA